MNLLTTGAAGNILYISKELPLLQGGSVLLLGKRRLSY